MVSQMKQAIDVVNSGNPMSVIQNMVAQNPQYQQILGLMQTCNGNPQQLVQNIAQQRGIDVNQLMQIYNTAIGG